MVPSHINFVSFGSISWGKKSSNAYQLLTYELNIGIVGKLIFLFTWQKNGP